MGRSTVFVENDGPFPIEVVGVEPVEGAHDFRLVARTEVAPGEQAEAIIEATINCKHTSIDETVPYALIVESAIGIERRISDPFTVAIPVFNCPAPG